MHTANLQLFPGEALAVLSISGGNLEFAVYMYLYLPQLQQMKKKTQNIPHKLQ